MDKPFLPLVVSFIIGILIINQCQISLIYLLIGLGISLLMLIFNILKDRKRLLNGLIIFVFLGMIMTTLQLACGLLKYSNERMAYVGTVEDILSSDDHLNQYTVMVEGNMDTREAIGERIRLNVIGNKPLNYGQKIVFNGVFNAPLDNTNPMLYNHRLHLLSNNIYGSMTIHDYSLELLDGPQELKYKVKEGFHKSVNSVFDTNLDEGNRRIIKSMILGDASHMIDEERQMYRELGLGHILAISGLHIGIIASFILQILMRLTISRKISTIITIGVLLIYGYLIGFPHSMMRAILMFSLMILTKLLHEHSNSINVLSLSALIVLLINPFSLFSLGFILSYTAVLSLCLFTKRIEMLFYPHKGYVFTTLSAILAVNLGLLPIQAYYFNYVSLLGIAANLINIPLLSLSLILSICMYVLNYIFPFLNIGLRILLNGLLDLERIVSSVLYGFSSSLIFNVPSPSLDMIFIYYLGITILLRRIDISVFQMNVKKSILMFLCFMIMINFVTLISDDAMELHFIDVGQGDSLLLRSQNGDILIDTGGSLLSNYVGEQITLPYLQKLGIKQLKGVIISHFDVDHAGALPILMDNIEIENIYGSYLPEDENIHDKIKNGTIPFTIAKAGDRLKIDKNTFCEVLWPEDIHGLSSNNKSLVLLLNYKGYEILLTGDIEKEAELALLDSVPSNVHLLKVAHHGSNTSTTDEFLKIAKPLHSVISVGRNNPFNHPSGDVMDRLNHMDTLIYRTDEMGLIKVHINKDINIQPFVEQGHKNVVQFVYECRWDLIFYLIYYIITKKLIILYKKSGADVYELR